MNTTINAEICFRPNPDGWKKWFAYYSRIGVPPPDSTGRTIRVDPEAATYIFGDNLSEFGTIIEEAV